MAVIFFRLYTDIRFTVIWLHSTMTRFFTDNLHVVHVNFITDYYNVLQSFLPKFTLHPNYLFIGLHQF